MFCSDVKASAALRQYATKFAIRAPTPSPLRKATRPAAPARVAVRPCVVADPMHIWKLHAREPGDLGVACGDPSRQAGGQRRKPYGPRARLRGVGQRSSTDESF